MHNKILTMFLVGMALFTTGCGTTTPPQSKQPIKLGATLALTGKFAFMGEAERRGLEMGVADFNAQGGVNGRPLQLIAEDNQGDAKTGVTTVQKLLDVDNIDILYSAFTHVTQAIKETIANSEKIMLYHSAINDIAVNNKNFFKDYIDIQDHTKTLLSAIQARGITSIKLLSEKSDVCDPFEQIIQNTAPTLGITVTQSEKYSGEDLKTPLTKLKNNNATLVTCAWKNTPTLMKELTELGMIDTQTFQFIPPFFPSGDTPEMHRLYEENKTVASWYGSGKGELAENFVQNFKQRYNEEPRTDSFYTYDEVFVIGNALKQCTTESAVDWECTREAMKKTNYTGVAGNITFDENKVSIRKTFLIESKGGKWEETQ